MKANIRYLHFLLAVQSLVVILVSINRLSTLTDRYVINNGFMRWKDLNNMLVFPLISAIAFYALKIMLESENSSRIGRAYHILNFAFIAGIFLLGAGYGVHEITNYLHSRFCQPTAPGELCRIVIFNDDEFSHWIFFVGFILINVALMLLQVVFPYPSRLTQEDTILLILNGIFIGAGIFANLAFEQIGLDLYVVALLALVSFILLRVRGAQPLLVYYSTAFGFGLVLTTIYKTVI
jgi:hypothetical protein